LAWAAFDGNISMVESMVDPQSAHIDLELAYFFAQHGMGEVAARHVARAGIPTDKADLDVSRATINELLSSAQFAAAYSAWSAIYGTGNSSNGAERFVNGDFAEAIPNDNFGFGWQLAQAPNVSCSIDPVGPGQNSRSLRVEYSGDSPPATAIIGQILLLRPSTRYTVSFTARTDGLVSGGLPVMVVADISTKVPKVLGQSSPLPPNTNGWISYTVNFSTAADTYAVHIQLQRLVCRETPCPIFGELRLARFALNRS